MNSIASQLHGYKQGHQLLDATLRLDKIDQTAIDRLSDVAGPLRPGERFEPYLTFYPTPSRKYYVVARTWQDDTVTRAGCVRTLSLVIPAADWAATSAVSRIVDFLLQCEFPLGAILTDFQLDTSEPLTPVPAFRASELLEALFLEDEQPVVLFDAPDPELIATRLLTALWPSLRLQFSISTFALSPRKIEGKFFNLVFAPKDARSKFSDWPGRRVDAPASVDARHRWTETIVQRVFNQPIPQLLTSTEQELIYSDETGNPSQLRIVLLWNDLLSRVNQTPSAALGLLDIANTKFHTEARIASNLSPVLTSAAENAVKQLPANEAWSLISAMIKKLLNSPTSPAISGVARAAAILSSKDPRAAVSFLEDEDAQAASLVLLDQISDGLNMVLPTSGHEALIHAQPQTLGLLLSHGRELANTMVFNPVLMNPIANALPELSSDDLTKLARTLLPILTENVQLAIAKPLIQKLNRDGLESELALLLSPEGQSASAFFEPLMQQAIQLNAMNILRRQIVEAKNSPQRDQFLLTTLSPSIQDLEWLFGADLSPDAVDILLEDLIRRATQHELVAAMKRTSLANTIVASLRRRRSETLVRIASDNSMPASLQMDVLLDVLQQFPDTDRLRLAEIGAARLLSEQVSSKDLENLKTLLEILGAALNGGWAAKLGLGRTAGSNVLNRNLEVFRDLSGPAKKQLLLSIDSLAIELAERQFAGINASGASACATLLAEAAKANKPAHLWASDRLLNIALDKTSLPVSPIIASTFAVVYSEMERNPEGLSLRALNPFRERDRRKAARRELVRAFLDSDVWAPEDLALTACRASESSKILKSVAKRYRGEDFFQRLYDNLEHLPHACRNQTADAMQQIVKSWPNRYSWSD